MRLAVHLWNMARIRKQMKKSIKSSSAKSPETQGHSLPEGLTEGSMKAGGLEPAKTGLRDRISPICTLSQNGYGRIDQKLLVAHAKLLLGKNFVPDQPMS